MNEIVAARLASAAPAQLADIKTPLDVEVDRRYRHFLMALGLGFSVLFLIVLVQLGVAWPVIGVSAGAIFVILAAAGSLVLQARRLVHSVEEREAMWRAAGDALPFPCFVVDQLGRATYANRQFLQRWPDSLHAPLAELGRWIGGDPNAWQVIERLETAGAQRSQTADEIRCFDPQGREIWLRFSVSPLGDRRSQMLWAVEDVTSRRQMEQVIREEQAKFVDFLENAPIGFYSVDPDGRFLLINRTLAEWLGTSAEEVRVRDQRLHDLLAEAPPSGTPAMSPFPGVGETRGEVQLKVAGGEVIHAFISQTIVGTSENGDMRTRSVVRNLSPERAWERALRRSEQRFQRFFEDAPVGIVLLDGSGKVTEANKAWRELVAPGHSQIVGSGLTEFVAEQEVREIDGWLRQILIGAVPASARKMELRALSETGRRRDVSVFVSRIDEGLILHFLEAGDQKSVEATFVQGQKMQAIGQLAGGIAHDFNNLLTAMIGFCDLLLLRHSPGDQSFGDIMQIKQNASRAANLVRQLLAFSRQQTLQPEVLNVTDILAELSHLLGRLIGANIKLNMVHGQDLGLVRVDQGQLEQVIINLAVNARDAMDEGGTLTIRTQNIRLDKPEQRDAEYLPSGEYVVVEITDTGHGIATDKLERIFEPFYTTKEVGQGTGLGLSTVYGIIKQTEGHIFVDSVVGEGTTFSIYLPHHKEDGTEAAVSEGTQDETRADLTGVGSVLLVEDEDAVRQFSARALRAKGYKVLEARSGEDAMSVLRNEQVDLLITDVVMPEMDGPTLIKLAKAEAPDLRVVCISGYAEDAFRKRIGEDSEIHFLAKPFSLAQLASKVKDVMASAEVGHK